MGKFEWKRWNVGSAENNSVPRQRSLHTVSGGNSLWAVEECPTSEAPSLAGLEARAVKGPEGLPRPRGPQPQRVRKKDSRSPKVTDQSCVRKDYFCAFDL